MSSPVITVSGKNLQLRCSHTLMRTIHSWILSASLMRQTSTCATRWTRPTAAYGAIRTLTRDWTWKGHTKNECLVWDDKRLLMVPSYSTRWHDQKCVLRHVREFCCWPNPMHLHFNMIVLPHIATVKCVLTWINLPTSVGWKRRAHYFATQVTELHPTRFLLC